MPSKAARAPPGGFDITPAAKPRPTGLSPHQKAMLALGVLAVLGAAAFVADWLTAKDGYTPSGGFEKLEDDGSPSQAAPASKTDPLRIVDGNASAPAPLPTGLAPS
jgi:hypothetical protein